LEALEWRFLLDFNWVALIALVFYLRNRFKNDSKPLPYNTLRTALGLILLGVVASETFIWFQKPFNDPTNDRTKVAVFKLMPLIPFSPYESSSDLYSPPDIQSQHYFGTDQTGRDWASRVVHGARTSLSVGFVAQSVSLLIGVSLGALAGYYRGWADIALMRTVEIVDSIPQLLLVLVIVGLFQNVNNLFFIMVIIGATSWTSLARLVRGEFLRLAEMQFAQASRALGASDFHIITRHLLPNTLGPILVTATFGVASAILLEASLSFLGFGVQPPTPAWGSMLAESEKTIDFAWWMLAFPGAVILMTLLSYNFIGEALRDAVDPRLQVKHN
jgi:peptide/nickel transport system permease protein